MDGRKVGAVLLGLVAAWFGYVTLTVPMIAATAPAVITIACGVGAYLLWPKEEKTETAE